MIANKLAYRYNMFKLIYKFLFKLFINIIYLLTFISRLQRLEYFDSCIFELTISILSLLEILLSSMFIRSIPANAQAAIYCTAIQNGTSDDWNFLWNKYLESNFASEKLVILNALGCSTDPEVLYA